MRGKAASGEEYIRLCENHIADEIAEIMEVSREFVSKLQAKYKVKPNATKRCVLNAGRRKNINMNRHRKRCIKNRENQEFSRLKRK